MSELPLSIGPACLCDRLGFWQQFCYHSRIAGSPSFVLLNFACGPGVLIVAVYWKGAGNRLGNISQGLIKARSRPRTAPRMGFQKL